MVHVFREKEPPPREEHLVARARRCALTGWYGFGSCLLLTLLKDHGVEWGAFLWLTTLACIVVTIGGLGMAADAFDDLKRYRGNS